MATIKFKGPKFTKLLQKAAAQKGCVPYTYKPAKSPGLWLVKDRGAYIMPSNDPRKIGIREKDWPDYIIYAPGFGPTCDWNKQQRTWGGDDFAMFVPIAPDFVKFIKEGHTVELELLLDGATENQLTVDAKWSAHVPSFDTQ